MSKTVIFHVDVNSAFLSWSAVKRLKNGEELDIRTVPSVIGGDENTRHGIVLAKSIPAGKYGIKTAESIYSARRKCPDLLVVPSEHKYYSECSKKFIAILKKYAPVVEQVSIDEAYCDFTGTEGIYGNLEEFAYKLKDEVKDTLGFTVNVGISDVKPLAKMASDFEKPDKVHTCYSNEVEKKIWPLTVDNLLFSGDATTKALGEIGIKRIGELANAREELIVGKLGEHGRDLWNLANGRATSIVRQEREAAKSYGHEITLPEDLYDDKLAEHIILEMTEAVAARVRADGVSAAVVSCKLTSNKFKNIQRQKKLPEPTDITNNIYEGVLEMYKKIRSLPEWKNVGIRLIGVSAAKVDSGEYEQMDFFKTKNNEKMKKLDAAVDSLREKFGKDAIKRATFLKK